MSGGGGASWDPRNGTLGSIGNAFQNGNWGTVGSQIQGGLAPAGNGLLSDIKNETGDATTGTGIGLLAATALGGDPLTSAAIGTGVGGALGAYNNTKNDVNSYNANQTGTSTPKVPGLNTKALTAAQQAKQKTQNNQNMFQQENSMEDALRAAQLKTSGQNANANFY